MTKKNLSDMLREEVDREGETVDVVATPTPIDETSKTTATPKSKRSTPPEPDRKMEELAEALAMATERANMLQNVVISLENELETQKNLVKTLQQQLQQQQEIETALEEQKTLAIHLSTRFTQAQTELEEQKHLVEKLYAQLQKNQLEPVTKPEPEPEPVQQLSLKKATTRYITPRLVAPNTPPTSLTNADIGWFD